ncbi:hypothetical protein GBAR_LOCUS31805 [Geodia barretti]|uniref:Uncharacterized protein n=1 Tax=Geodia barretti TaxID=519541 RepID=A0AA35XGZ6_GEOBA|nr:hypothetical protein GBAR_LOCUS31805 [Geodia barretti]
MLLENRSGNFGLQFRNNRFWHIPSDDEGARTNFGNHHGTLSQVVVRGILLSKLLHIFQCHILLPLKLAIMMWSRRSRGSVYRACMYGFYFVKS